MMMMNRISKERSSLKPAASTVRRYVNAQSTPATPMMKDEMASREQLGLEYRHADDARRRLVIRIARKWRTVAERTSRQVRNVRTVTIVSENNGANEVENGIPKARSPARR